MSIENRPVDRLDGGARRTALESRTCSACGSEANEFRDQKSSVEYGLSGMCQDCQDAFFTESSRDFELHGPDAVITITVDIKHDGSTTIEAFAYRQESDDIDPIGNWTVDKETRPIIESLVTATVDTWRSQRNIALDEEDSQVALVYDDLKRFLETS